MFLLKKNIMKILRTIYIIHPYTYIYKGPFGKIWQPELRGRGMKETNIANTPKKLIPTSNYVEHYALLKFFDFILIKLDKLDQLVLFFRWKIWKLKCF